MLPLLLYHVFVDKRTTRAKTRVLSQQEQQIENENDNRRRDRAIMLRNNNRVNCNIVSLYKSNRHLTLRNNLISRYNVSRLYNPNNSLVADRSENKENAPFARSPLIYKAVVVYKTLVTC